MALNPRRMLNILEALDWQGHVELPIRDLSWLAHEIAASLTSSDFQRCDNCGAFNAICIPTGLGRICRECIEQAQEAVDSAQEEIEGRKDHGNVHNITRPRGNPG